MKSNQQLMEDLRGAAWEGAGQFNTLVDYYTDKDGNLWPNTSAYLQAVRKVGKYNHSQQPPRKPELVSGYPLECHTEEFQTLMSQT